MSLWQMLSCGMNLSATLGGHTEVGNNNNEHGGACREAVRVVRFVHAVAHGRTVHKCLLSVNSRVHRCQRMSTELGLELAQALLLIYAANAIYRLSKAISALAGEMGTARWERGLRRRMRKNQGIDGPANLRG